MSLTGHIVLVTGAAGTLGRATAEAVRAAGGIVVATDLRPGEGIDLAHDVTSEAGWAAVIAECEARHGRLDGLVNNAGVIVQGRYDMICPPATALRLARAWPAGVLKLIDEAGHALSEPGIAAELIRATDRLAGLD